jgi:hypothetical protein
MAEINTCILSGVVEKVERIEKGDFEFAVVTLKIVSEWQGKRKEQLVPLTAYRDQFADVDALVEGGRAVAQFKIGARENKGFTNLTATIVSIVQVNSAKESKRQSPPPVPGPAPSVGVDETDVPF